MKSKEIVAEIKTTEKEETLLQKRVDARMVALGKSKVELAEQMNVTRMTLHNWLSAGANNIKHGIIVKMAEVLGVSLAYLIEEEETAWDESRSPAPEWCNNNFHKCRKE